MKPELTIDTLLDLSCSSPEDFAEWSQWDQEHTERINTPGYDHSTDYVPYKGWNRYTIALHCQSITVVARKNVEGQYVIKDWIVQDH